MPATISDNAHNRLKAAQKDLVSRCGGIERSASVSGYSPSQMHRYSDTKASPDLMPLHVVALLEAECGVPYVTSAMAEINGHRLAAPEADGAQSASVERDVFACNTEVMRQVAALTMAVADALADGKLTPTEIDKISRQTAPVRDLLAKLDMALANGRAAGGQVLKFEAGA